MGEHSKGLQMVGLVGKITAGGWVVEEAVEMPVDRSGGYFSSCFLVSKDGKQAFLKALDIEKFDVNDLLAYLEGLGSMYLTPQV
jgi:eukaryotic-like serine/threonine-protein kinase